MLKATLRQGVIVPLEPVPSEWIDGVPLEVDYARSEIPDSILDFEEWVRVMESLCADSVENDEMIMRLSIGQQRQEAKAQMLREMGLTA